MIAYITIDSLRTYLLSTYDITHLLTGIISVWTLYVHLITKPFCDVCPASFELVRAHKNSLIREAENHVLMYNA